MTRTTTRGAGITGAALLAIALTACASVAAPETKPTGPGCDAPLAITDSTGTTALLLGNGTSSIDYAGDFQAVQDGAMSTGDRFILNTVAAGPDAPSLLTNVLMVGEGNNKLERDKNLECKKAKIAEAITTVTSTEAPATVDVFSPMMTLQGNLESSFASGPVNVVVVASTINGTSPSLADPGALENPAGILNTLAEMMMRPDCTGWSISIVDTSGVDTATNAKLREFWRQYAQWCGGKLVAWTTHLTEFPGNGDPIPAADTTPIIIEETPTEVTATLSGDVLFAPGSWDLRPEAAGDLEKLLEVASGHPGSIVVTGHTDVGGSEPDNEVLGMNRATVLKTWLIANGIDPDRIMVKTAGSTEALYPNPQDDTEHQANRRVVVIVGTV